ncbi:MlaD family protein [Pseudonocardia pini]|uniref:MlaD family protein n=1 Tax=Pseudonocardia pini TaxID=2758030 RepID=UPI0015F0E3A6|nr:MlaD family protein [Pseudonocardia pini]
MKISYSALPAIRTGILVAFVALSGFVFLYFWTSVGGYVPLYTQKAYQVKFDVDHVNNLVPQSDVTLAGIVVGEVESITPTADGKAAVVANISDEKVLPLHEGVNGRINAKTLVEETYVSLQDGTGPELADDTVLPAGAVQPAVTIDDVVRALPDENRVALAGTLQSLGAATAGTQDGVSGTLQGLGALGREGGTALSALSAQSAQLEELSANTTKVLAALDTRRGQIAELVSDANLVTQATAGSFEDIQTVVRKLPGVLTTAKDASDDLSKLAHGLQPVADNLDRAAPALNAALNELPATTGDLRSLLPSLDQTLDKAPATLDRVPVLSDDLVELMPNADKALAQLNPMLEYLQPYGGDLYQFFTSFGWTVARGDTNGTLLRVMPVFHAQSFKGNPVPMNELAPLDDNDPYPRPGTQANPPDDSPPPQVDGPSTTGN